MKVVGQRRNRNVEVCCRKIRIKRAVAGMARRNIAHGARKARRDEHRTPG